MLSAGYYDAFYIKAQKVRRLIADEFDQAFAQVDVLMGPTTPTVAFEIGAKTADPSPMYLNDIYTIGANLAGLPAMSIPCGFAQNLPLGLQIIGRTSPKSDCSAPPTPISEKPTGTRVCRLAMNNETWETVIGLEIHAQLATKSKIFSARPPPTAPPPNAQAIWWTWGYPGVLPVLNQAAVGMAVKFGVAIAAQVTPVSVFARKNYFYPDLPKGYQISQYELPIVGKGSHGYRAGGRDDQTHRHHPGSSGGGCRQVHA